MAEPASRWIIQLIQASQGKQTVCYTPYSIGLLEAYALRHATDIRPFTFMPPHFERLPVDEAVRQIQLADIFGFSVYVWNIEYSLALARRIKAAKPAALIIFGGPQVPDQAEDFLRSSPFIDVCVHGEGERVFLKLLESLPDKHWENIDGISWLENGDFRHAPPGPRLTELDTIPSPYLMGIFDPLLARPDITWVPLWETNRGCPFSCTFCDWGSATAAKVQRFGLERLKAEIDWFAAHKLEVINCCDANFGILPRDLEIAEHLVLSKQQTGYPRSFYMQAAKNVTERSYEIQRKIFAEGLHFMITLALQSVSPEVLKHIKRDNISLETYRQVATRFRRDGVDTYTDLLVGLPGETYDSFVDGVARVIDEGQHHWISFYNAYLLPNAELASPAQRERHGIRSARIRYSETWLPVEQEEPEWQEMVIETKSMSLADFCRMRSFAWWVQTIYHDAKPLQLPLLVLRQLGGISWRTIFEYFNEGHFAQTPILSQLHGFIRDKALRLTRGDAEHCQYQQGREAIWIKVPKYLIIGLSAEPVAKAFFAEALQALRQLAAKGRPLPEGLLEEALELSEAMFLDRMQQQDFVLAGHYNLWDWYQGQLRDEPIALLRQESSYVHAQVAQGLGGRIE